MDVIFLELLLWGGLLFFFWALKDGLGRIEADIEAVGLMNSSSGTARFSDKVHYYRPERVSELIGSYGDAQIYRYAVFNGRVYQFDRVCPSGCSMEIDPDERCIEPGLVYQECRNPINLSELQ